MTSTEGSQDPEVLAAQIERTREDLAETLDAIADKVSPKRVTARTRRRVVDALDAVTGRTRTAASGAVQATAAASAPPVDLPPVKAVQVGDLDLSTPAGARSAPAGTSAGTPAGTPAGGAPLSGGGPAARPGVRPEVVAGSVVGLLVLLLLRRRRARRRAAASAPARSASRRRR